MHLLKIYSILDHLEMYNFGKYSLNHDILYVQNLNKFDLCYFLYTIEFHIF